MTSPYVSGQEPRIEERHAGWRTTNRAILASCLAVAIAFAYGALTSVLQLIPGPLNGLANTVSGWVMPVIALAWLLGGRPIRAAITSALTFVALCIGYSVMSTLRGYPGTETMWAAIGLVAGPVIGAAVSLLRHRRAAVAAASAGVLTGILLGDASFGAINNSHYWATWIIAGCAGLFLFAIAAARRSFSGGILAAQIAATVVVAALYWLAFAALNALMASPL